jgi:PTS system mannose-specific IIA component
MIGTLILTHGGTAHELLKAAQKIAGPLVQIEAISLDWDERPDQARNRVLDAIDRLDTGQGVLVLTDMFGSTPSNVAVSCANRGRVEILSGVNLPMLLRLACMPQPLSLPELAHWLQGKTQKSVCVASDMPAGKKCAAPKGGAEEVKTAAPAGLARAEVPEKGETNAPSPDGPARAEASRNLEGQALPDGPARSGVADHAEAPVALAEKGHG